MITIQQLQALYDQYTGYLCQAAPQLRLEDYDGAKF